MIVILCLLGSAVVFLAIVVCFLYFQIIRPMRRRQEEQEDTIRRNAGASIGLYMTHCREIHSLANTVAFIEAYTVPNVLPEVEEAPITVRSARLQKVRS
jgi:hypothetical protein